MHSGRPGSEIWLDGERKANQTAAVSRAVDTSGVYRVTSDAYAVDFATDNMNYPLYAMWNRVLTAGEIRRIARDPFGMLRPWRPVPAGGGGTTHALSGTLPFVLAVDSGLEVRRGLSSALPLALTLGGPVEVRRALAGALPLALTLGGPVEVRRALGGTLPLALQLSGALATGPAALGDLAVSDAARGGLAATVAAFGGIGLVDTAASGGLEVSDG